LVIFKNHGVLFMLTSQPNRPLCKNCDISLAKPNGISKYGFQRWHKYCVDCAKMLYNPKFEYLKGKKSTCERCEFVPEDSCQLDVIRESNQIRVLCANCSRVYRKSVRLSKRTLLDITVDADVRI
jgi:hypothetical protein